MGPAGVAAGVADRRLDLAEDALGEAFARASDRWTGEGWPANPAGWLYATAYRHVVGQLEALGHRVTLTPAA